MNNLKDQEITNKLYKKRPKRFKQTRKSAKAKKVLNKVNQSVSTNEVLVRVRKKKPVPFIGTLIKSSIGKAVTVLITRPDTTAYCAVCRETMVGISLL